MKTMQTKNIVSGYESIATVAIDAQEELGSLIETYAWATGSRGYTHPEVAKLDAKIQDEMDGLLHNYRSVAQELGVHHPDVVGLDAAIRRHQGAYASCQ